MVGLLDLTPAESLRRVLDQEFEMDIGATNTMGELGIAMAVQGADFEISDPDHLFNPVSEGWEGDLLAMCSPVQRQDTWNGKAVWVTVWDENVDRNQFMTGFMDSRERDAYPVMMIPVGDDVAIAAFGFTLDEAMCLQARADDIQIGAPAPEESPEPEESEAVSRR